MSLQDTQHGHLNIASCDGAAFAARVLLADLNSSIAHLVAHNLELDGYRVDIVNSYDDMLEMLSRRRFDAIVIDEEFSPNGALDVADEIRAIKMARSLPIIWLSGDVAESASPSIVSVPKPVAMHHLLNAVHQSAWTRSETQRTGCIVAGDVTINLSSLRVKCGGRNIELSMMDFKILKALASQPGRVLSRHDLLEAVWGSGATIELETINQHIVRLRRALRGSRASIRTVRTAGYALEVD